MSGQLLPLAVVDALEGPTVAVGARAADVEVRAADGEGDHV